MRKTILPGLLLLTLCGCYNDKEELLYPASPCKTDSVTFSASVKPILDQNCAISGCHDAATASHNIVLDNVAGAQTVARGGRLLGAINHASGFFEMPKGQSKLDDCSIQKISKWVAEGSPNNY